MEEWQYKPAQDLGIGEMERLRSVKRESGLLGFLARKTWWFWVRAVLRLSERIQINGTEHLPATPPFIIVANHASHLDVLVLATALPLRCGLILSVHLDPGGHEDDRHQHSAYPDKTSHRSNPSAVQPY